MKQTTTTLAPQRRPGLQTLKSALQRLSMTLMLVMLTATAAWAQGVDYIDANGVVKNTATDDIVGNDDPTVLTGGGETRLSAGWYVVNDNITHTGTVTLDGEVTIILANGKTMNICTSESPVTGNGINGFGHSLTIYGQTLDEGTAGQLRIYTSYTRFGTAGILSSTYTQHSGNVTINSYGNNALAGSNITINGGKLDATASTGWQSSNDVNALAGSNITMNGGIVNATGIQYNDAHSAKGIYCTTFTLRWTNATDRFTASSYDGTVTIADGQVFTDGSGHYYSGTLSSDDKTAIAGETLAPAVPYVDADGQTDYCTNFTVLTGSETMLAPGWYVVNSDITYDHNLELSDEGTVNIILADGKTMTINVGPYDNPGISDIAGEKNLTIYGQTAQDGTLSITAFDVGIYCGTLTINSGTVNVSSSTNSIYATWVIINGGTVNVVSSSASSICATWVIINGGVVTATANGKDVNNQNVSNLLFYSILGSEGVSINGGQVTATGNSGRIASGNSSDITLGYTKATDFISFKIINAAGEVKIANDKSMTDGTNIYNSSTSSETLEALTNVTLTPYGMTLAAKEATVNDETNYWTTYYCGDAGLAIDDAENACAYTATVSGETITLHKLGKVIPQGTAVIIVGADASIGMTVSTADAENVVDNHLHGLDAATPLNTVKTSYGADAILMLSNKNDKFGFHDVALTNIPARKAFLAIDDPDPSQARQFTMVFDENTTAINEHESHKSHELSGAWYTLDGRRIANGQKPTAKGLYIVNGRKVVIK